MDSLLDSACHDDSKITDVYTVYTSPPTSLEGTSEVLPQVINTWLKNSIHLVHQILKQN